MWEHSTMREMDSNPIRILRTANHKSLQELSELCGVHLQTIYLNECGVFPTVLPKIRTTLNRKYDADLTKLDADYKKYIFDQRKTFSVAYADKIDSLPEADLTRCPMGLYRKGISPSLSRMGFAKTICVEPAGMYRLEVFPLAAIPGRIREALLQVGLSSPNLEELEERTNEFYSRTR
jgi:transcriptional regulator with XRE-family HTH domain